MSTRDHLEWFKTTFHSQIEPAIAGTPYSLDLLAAMALQETGEIWGRLRKTLDLDTLLEICVGDVIDADGGRSAFPRTRADLVAARRGDEMFTIGHDALVAMARHVPVYARFAARPNKFCHGYGIFQYDIQFFKEDPDYFLNREWRRFDRSLAKAVEDLRSAQKRIPDLRGRTSQSELEQVSVAIAYNAGSFIPSRGLKQGFKSTDGKFYGEMIFDFLRLSQTASIPAAPSALPEPAPGVAPLARPTAVTSDGQVLEVDVRETPLRLRSEPKI